MRSPVVVYGENAAFEALLEAPHVKQLLIFDKFGPDLDVRELTHVFEPVVARHSRRVCVVAVDATHREVTHSPRTAPAALGIWRLWPGEGSQSGRVVGYSSSQREGGGGYCYTAIGSGSRACSLPSWHLRPVSRLLRKGMRIEGNAISPCPPFPPPLPRRPWTSST